MNSGFRSAAGLGHQRDDLTAVVLVNLGTPDAPTSPAVRRYLAEFLWDPRVIEQPRWFWWVILHGVILRLRPARSAHAYQAIWTERGSPLLVGTRDLGEAVSTALGADQTSLVVRYAMRYGSPSIASVLRELADRGLRRLLIVPLYPQYSATTTASVFDAVSVELASWRYVPELRLINDYFADPLYIQALARSVRAHWQSNGRSELLLMSFHGIPERYIDSGDPYFCHCQATARLLAAALEMKAEEYRVTFQSRVGREKWLSPYTDSTLIDLARSGVKNVDAICPGFAVDCLETLEEIAITNRAAFVAAGGERLSYIAALNTSPEHVALMTDLVRRHGGGWPGLDAHVAAGDNAETRNERRAALLATGNPKS